MRWCYLHTVQEFLHTVPDDVARRNRSPSRARPRRRGRRRARAGGGRSTPQARIASIAEHIWQGAIDHPNVTALAHQAGAIDVLEQHARQALAAELAAAGVRGRAARDAMTAILLCVAGFLVVSLGEVSAEAPDRRLFRRTIGAVIDAFVPPEQP
jgi:hypothetical protein